MLFLASCPKFTFDLTPSSTLYLGSWRRRFVRKEWGESLIIPVPWGDQKSRKLQQPIRSCSISKRCAIVFIKIWAHDFLCYTITVIKIQQHYDERLVSINNFAWRQSRISQPSQNTSPVNMGAEYHKIPHTLHIWSISCLFFINC